MGEPRVRSFRAVLDDPSALLSMSSSAELNSSDLQLGRFLLIFPSSSSSSDISVGLRSTQNSFSVSKRCLDRRSQSCHGVARDCGSNTLTSLLTRCWRERIPRRFVSLLVLSRLSVRLYVATPTTYGSK